MRAFLESTVNATPSCGRTSTNIVPAPGGMFELEVDSDVEIVATARFASGSSLIATHATIRGAYGDEQVLGSRSAFAGADADAAPTVHAKAKSPGTATVAVVGGGAGQELSFRVVE